MRSIIPAQGRSLYRGTPLTELRDLAAYRAREIGFIFQAFHLLPTFTAEENVQIPMFETAAPDRRAPGTRGGAAQVGRPRASARPFSRETFRRRTPARRHRPLLANGPGVLLADEPTGNLDSKNAQAILDLLTRLHAEQGMTMILVTHDMAVARRASRALQMNDGRVIFDGDPAQLPPTVSAL